MKIKKLEARTAILAGENSLGTKAEAPFPQSHSTWECLFSDVTWDMNGVGGTSGLIQVIDII